MNPPQPGIALTECDREAIHLIGAVQRFGGLIAWDSEGQITHASANCGELLGLAHTAFTGAPLASVLAPTALAALAEARAALTGRADAVERRFGVDLTASGARYDCALHLSGALAVLEFEPHAAASYADHVGMIGPVLAELEGCGDPQALCETAARLVRRMLGYDRVMVYRFHADESGEVIAEDCAAGLTPLLGLRYPAADIPRQARDLFRRNRFRVIADIEAADVPIHAAPGASAEPLDLSMSVLRAHSQVHLAYMRNLGVAASLTIAVVRGERLWGMISCHHQSPRLPPYSLRTVAELFSQTFSVMLDRQLVRDSEAARARARALTDRLAQQLAGGASLADNLLLIEQALGSAIAHDGIAIFHGGAYRSSGAAPGEAEFLAIAPGLAPALAGGVVASTRLADLVPAAAAFAACAAGALVLPLSRMPRDCLILWRRPLEQTVTWAGDPAKARAAPGQRLEPRTSFAAWTEIVRGHSAEWSEEDCAIAEGLRHTLAEVILRLGEELGRERERAAERQALLIAELNHRVRNILGLIRGLVSQSQHDALSVAGFAEVIGARIAALASAHDNITRENWAPASLAGLLRSELAPYCDAAPERVRLVGEDVLLRPEAFTVVALTVHELATNSAKYGSLSARAGVLEIGLSRTAFGDLALAWRERGGPPVTAPTRTGFGSTIIRRSVPHELKGEAELRFRLAGLEADFVIPQRWLAEPEGRSADAPALAPRLAPAAASSRAAAVLPASVLVVEDSIVIALDTEEQLRKLGVAAVRIEGSVAGALAAIAEAQPDLAIIDFNLGDESSEPVAQALRARGVPFVLATGYSSGNDDFAALGAGAVLRKPYGAAELERLLREWSPPADGLALGPA